MITLTALSYMCLILNLSPLNTGDQTQAISPVSNTVLYPSPPKISPQKNLWTFAAIVTSHLSRSYLLQAIPCPAADKLPSLLTAASSAVQLCAGDFMHSSFCSTLTLQSSGSHAFAWYAVTLRSNGGSSFSGYQENNAVLFVWLIIAFNKKTLRSQNQTTGPVISFIGLFRILFPWLWHLPLKIRVHISVYLFHTHASLPNYSTYFFLINIICSVQVLRCLQTICSLYLSVLHSCYTSFLVLFLFIKLKNLDCLFYYYLLSLSCFTSWPFSPSW